MLALRKDGLRAHENSVLMLQLFCKSKLISKIKFKNILLIFTLRKTAKKHKKLIISVKPRNGIEQRQGVSELPQCLSSF
jgi:hypothetical protein